MYSVGQKVWTTNFGYAKWRGMDIPTRDLPKRIPARIWEFRGGDNYTIIFEGEWKVCGWSSEEPRWYVSVWALYPYDGEDDPLYQLYQHLDI